jgi:hypothetical protein
MRKSVSTAPTITLIGPNLSRRPEFAPSASCTSPVLLFTSYTCAFCCTSTSPWDLCRKMKGLAEPVERPSSLDWTAKERQILEMPVLIRAGGRKGRALLSVNRKPHRYDCYGDD